MTVAILTMSDSVAEDQAQDVNGLALKKLVEDAGMEVVATQTVPDDQEQIAAWLHRSATVADVLLTCGGTGPGARCRR